MAKPLREKWCFFNDLLGVVGGAAAGGQKIICHFRLSRTIVPDAAFQSIRIVS